MTRNQLIKKLQESPGNPEILIASDSEGNSFNTFDDIYTGENNDLRYIRDGYEIQLIGREDVEDDGMTEREFSKAKPCVVFFP